MMTTKPTALVSEFHAAEERREALGYFTEAFAEALLAGVESGCFARAALDAAFHELVGIHGEEEVALFAERLPERIRHGEFTVTRKH
ncbi:hypothetical protein [Terripilifer ovatus]|uniref:hypothetical protein n=1 Tax=Terripilifer ovatus TaxID=3032367 RepID=UPI003AB95E27